MKNMFRGVGMAAVVILAGAAGVRADVEIGKPAPAFSLPGSDGKTYSLADHKGTYVVLEWYNKDCPFIQKHYEPGHMQKIQDQYVKKGVVWFEIASSASGREGYYNAEELQKIRAKVGSKATATLLDPDGTVGQAYKAKTTPHMFIIDPNGNVIYNGAFDDHPTPYSEDIPKSKNYVTAALDEAMAGKPVSKSLTRPYGCSVKYK